MNRTLHKIVSILDGKPKAVRGQSFVEMALTMPLLITMLLGMVEIGFLANNYLILTDAVREAGRKAVNLTSDTGAPHWNLPLVPNGTHMSYTYSEDRNAERMNCGDKPAVFNLLGDADPGTDRYGNSPTQFNQPANWLALQTHGYYLGGKPVPSPAGFFDIVACQFLAAMQPMYFDEGRHPESGDTSKDELVISAISYMRQDPIKDSSGNVVAGSFALPHMRVTGRWPMANRWCGTDSRDPFDPDQPSDFGSWQVENGSLGAVDPASTIGQSFIDQTIPEDAIAQQDGKNPRYDNKVRGFIMTGQYTTADGCLGSDWTVQKIEAQLAFGTSMGSISQSLTNSMANGGLVIIELHWQHHPLFFGPLFQGFIAGTRTNDPILNISGFFPVPSAEPTATP